MSEEAVRQGALVLPRKSRLGQVVTVFQKKPLGAIGGVVLLLMVAVAVLAPQLARYDPIAQDVPNRLSPPSATYWFGTDTFGRDQYSRIVYGARVSLYVGLLSVAAATAGGTLLGLVSAFVGGWLDLVVQRLVDAFMGFPGLVLALALVTALGPSLNNVTIAIAVGMLPGFIRLARSITLTIKEDDYVLAARAAGASSGRIVGRHVLPNGLAPIIIVATGHLGGAIVQEAGLSFLGLGVPPPSPSWGGMLQVGAQRFQEAAPWLTIAPGIALTLGVFGFNLFGDALRDTLDPRLRGR